MDYVMSILKKWILQYWWSLNTFQWIVESSRFIYNLQIITGVFSLIIYFNTHPLFSLTFYLIRYDWWFNAHKCLFFSLNDKTCFMKYINVIYYSLDKQRFFYCVQIINEITVEKNSIFVILYSVFLFIKIRTKQ